MNKSELYDKQSKNALAGRGFFSKPNVKKPEKKVVASDSTNDSRVDSHHDSKEVLEVYKLDRKLLRKIIKSTAKIQNPSIHTPIRFTEAEKNELDEFLYDLKKKHKLEPRGITMSKVIRYVLKYILKAHKEELTQALEAEFGIGEEEI